MKSDLIDVNVIFVSSTEKAYCIKETEDGDKIWLPKSQCEIDGDEVMFKNIITLTAPEWLLKEKGLI